MNKINKYQKEILIKMFLLLIIIIYSLSMAYYFKYNYSYDARCIINFEEKEISTKNITEYNLFVKECMKQMPPSYTINEQLKINKRWFINRSINIS